MIEIPKGSRNKYEYDKERKFFRLDRMLYSSVHYPCDYGYIMDTDGLDGDPLDALVLVWEPTFPGCVIEVKPIGVFRMTDDKGQDEKVLCVPTKDPINNHMESLSDVPAHFLKEVEHFFQVYKELEKKETKIEGWNDVADACKIVQEAQARYSQRK